MQSCPARGLPGSATGDLGKVEHTILAALEKNSHVLKAPEPWAGVSELQEYAVQMFVRCDIRGEDYWKALPSIQRDVKDALDKTEILLAVTRQAPITRYEPMEPGRNAATPAEKP